MVDVPGQDNLNNAESSTQDDIDALLKAAEGLTELSGAAETLSDADGAGGLSQADIDAAPAATSGGAAPAATDTAGAGGLTQAEIDAAMAASAAAQATPPADERVDSTGRPFGAAAAAMAAAIQEERAASSADSGAEPPVPSVELPDFTGSQSDGGTGPQSIDLLHDVDLKVRIELGRTRMYIADVLRLGEGSVVELDKLAGDPVDVFVNDRLVARGEVLVLNDNFCVRVSEVISDEHERVLN